MIWCITGAQKCFNGVGKVCVGMEIAFVASCLMYCGMVGFGGDTSDGVGFCGVCIGCLTVVLNIFDR